MNADALAPPAPPALAAPALAWRNRFAALGEAYYTRLPAQPLPQPHWVARSDDCARWLGLPPDWWQRGDALAVFSGEGLWPGMDPLATVYSGHQFGVWAGQLGDGRALWLGEIDTPQGPVELQLKGAGRTPYSRMGDGRAVLRSSIREFLCSEAMHALGIPTTRALAITGSALPVRRESIESAAVVTRAAPSFVRFGHFEHFAARGQQAELRKLADFVIDAHFPECRGAPQAYLAFFETVLQRTARLVAHWQAVGFSHGVMNTDNMSILGLTIDYGPYGFLDAYDPDHICNHSDERGRYAYGRQGAVAHWNLYALAQALLPLFGEGDAAGEAALALLESYKPVYAAELAARMAAKLGLAGTEAGDEDLVRGLLERLAADRVDFTIAFRRLSRFASADGADNALVRDLFIDRDAWDAWAARYAERLRRESSVDTERRARMDAVNPAVVLRNHLAETAIREAEAGDFGEVARLLNRLQHPYAELDAPPDPYAAFPPDWATTIEVSCSS